MSRIKVYRSVTGGWCVWLRWPYVEQIKLAGGGSWTVLRQWRGWYVNLEIERL